MKISPTLLKAAIERHNQRAKVHLEVAMELAEVDHLKKIGAAGFTKEALKINEKFRELNKRVEALGLQINSIDNEDGNVTVALDWHKKHAWERNMKEKIAALDSRCRETTVATVLLAAAASGTDDVADVLDSLKLNWRDDGK